VIHLLPTRLSRIALAVERCAFLRPVSQPTSGALRDAREMYCINKRKRRKGKEERESEH